MANDQWEDIATSKPAGKPAVKDSEWEDVAPSVTAPAPVAAPNAPFPSWEPSQDDQSKYPIASALAQEGLTDLNEAQAKAGFAANHPIINAAGDILSMGTPGLITSPVKTLTTLGRGALKSIAGSGIGRWVGGEVGGMFGPQGTERGKQIGSIAGGVAGPFVSPSTFAKLPFGLGRIALSDEELATARASQKLAQRNADIKAGIRTITVEPSMTPAGATPTNAPSNFSASLPAAGSVPQPRLAPPPGPPPLRPIGGTPTAGPLGTIPMELPAPGSVPQPRLIEPTTKPRLTPFGGTSTAGPSSFEGALPPPGSVPQPKIAPVAEEEGIRGSTSRASGRLVLTPNEARTEEFKQALATKRASQHGMQYAAGMRPAGGGRVPFTSMKTEEFEYPQPGAALGRIQAPEVPKVRIQRRPIDLAAD